MDNLAHTLAGAALAEAGLKEKTGLGLATLMIAANLPDVDVIALAFGENLAFRRGVTHGPIGLLILPALLVAAMVWFDRWQTRRGKRPEARLPVRFGWLLVLAYVGALSHPALDWLNTYGVRLLSPFTERWFYGDTLFIIDVWLWTMLTIGVVWSQRRRRRGLQGAHWPALVSLVALLSYIGLMFGGSQRVKAAAAEELGARGLNVAAISTGPPPINPFRRDIAYLADSREVGWGRAQLFGGESLVLDAPAPDNMDDPRVALAASKSKALRDFLFWARMPFARFEGSRVIVTDARYTNIRAGGPFTVEVDLGEAPPPPE
ncbi:hypothetical protein B5C34_01255 [Pacificimonas flava]|uniref:Metal-dependent hydrolase n=2 Tax=Pacificimonas TaxID=1960290 RepID=A0A219B1K4_9SPHN|nr:MULTISPECIES: metal-dependent hydrolase [Pacificimonas]MBZ6378157.1 metal-dependent hydrolase [Pacificimonas aurantium]OWV32211.1 hypothetical protein B5C34_01255 [Pacificimonas flava]